MTLAVIRLDSTSGQKMRHLNFYLILAFVVFVNGAATKIGRADTVWGVTDQQFLVSWSTDSPSNFTFGTAINGLQVNERILGIDARPADGSFYAVGSSNRLYSLGMNGVATQIGSSFATSLNGSSFGFDFNPVIDRSRVDTNTNRNYVVNPNDGTNTQVNDLFYLNGDSNFGRDPNVVHIGYTNSVAGATSTQLYGIDSGLDILVTQANSSGSLNTIGSLGTNITEIGGFDIAGDSGIAYGAFLGAGSSASQFYRVDLLSGNATLIGEIGGGTIITAISLQSVPEPGSATFVGLSSLFLILRRKRA